MNEKLETALNALIERLEKTEKFVLDQAPSVCQEIITERLIEYYTEFGQLMLGWLLSFSCIMIGMRCYIGSDRDDFSHDWPIILGVLSLIGFIFLSFCMIYSVSKILFVNKCPKIILLREFSKLLKK